MIRPQHKLARVLGISFSTRGVGFALMEEGSTLVDWGLRVVKGDKNARCLSHVANLIARYEPNVIALEDLQLEGSRRASRIQLLSKQIIEMANAQEIRLKLFSGKQIRLGLLNKTDATKHSIAELLATRFPEELAFRLPKRRRCGMNADPRMDIFDAVALAEQCFQSVFKRRNY